MKQILIVNYGFPPNPGVGGRRWALFAKYLSKKGYRIHVLSYKYQGKLESAYSNILEDDNIILHKLPTFYPEILNTSPKTIKEKILYRLWHFFLSVYSKGTLYDKVIFGKKRIQKKALRIINNNNIQNVIVSGAPFRLCYYFAEIKNHIPNLIIDFRDPWTWGEGYGYNNLNLKKFNFEKKMETFVIENSDIILVPYKKMLTELEELHPKSAHRIKFLPHGFDKEDIVPRKKNTLIKKHKINLIYIGTIYDGLNIYFEEIVKAIELNNIEIKIDFFGSNKSKLSVSSSHFNFYDQIKPKELFIKIQNYDFCLIVNPHRVKDYISTKFYEIIYSKTPILYVGNKGQVSHFITSEKLGVYIAPNNISDSFKAEFIFYPYKYNPKIDIEMYSFEQLTKNLITFFK